MSTSKQTRVLRYERYDLESSPLSQNPTQRALAQLLGVKKSALENLVDHKEDYTIRRREEIRGKMRDLAYPKGKLRTIHEKLKFQLNKVKQPGYLYSPRKNYTLRSHARHHLGQVHFLKIDIRQFYPSTTSEHIFRWAKYTLGMRDDVAGLFVKLVTIDDKASFGSPVTPVLTTLVHRRMFDAIYELCRRRGLKMSLWVDDLTISGRFITGGLLEDIRDAIRANGLKSHNLQFLTGSRSVAVTGLLVSGVQLNPPRSLHTKIQEAYSAVYMAEGLVDFDFATRRLLGALGTYRHIVGRASPRGQTVSNRMNSARRHRDSRFALAQPSDALVRADPPSEEAPWA